MTRAVFLDRDGTLNVEKDYLCDPDKLELFPGVEAAMKRLQEAGFALFVVTNQSGIGRGYYTESDMHRVNERMIAMLAAEGVRVSKIYFSPEAPDQPSRTRKPSPEMLFDARKEFSVDLARSFMVGDKLIDLECGWNAGVQQSILVRTGYGTKWEAKALENPRKPVVVDDLAAAADWILSQP